MVRITHARRVGVVNTMNGRTNVTGGGSNGSLGGVIPLEAPSNFTVTPDNGKCLLTWTDPKDKYADEIGEITDEGDQLVSQFAYTRIVRKVGSAPSNPNDGDLVTDSSTRNQYQSSAYEDDGLTNNTLYYYAAFTCNTDGVYSGAAVGSGTPKSYDPILANNTWEQINDVANEGIAASVWEIGDEHSFIVNSENHIVNIIGFNHDDLSDGTGKAAVSFGMKDLMNNLYEHAFTGDNYTDTKLYKLISTTLYSTIDQSLQPYILQVNKKSGIECNFGWKRGPYTHAMKVFAFADTEIGGSSYQMFPDDYPGDGPMYTYYSTAANRIKQRNGTNASYWLRSQCVYTRGVDNQYAAEYITAYGHIEYETNSYGPDEYGVCFGFCIGKTPA